MPNAKRVVGRQEATVKKRLAGPPEFHVEFAEDAIDEFKRAVDAIDRTKTCREKYDAIERALFISGEIRAHADSADSGYFNQTTLNRWTDLEDRFYQQRHAFRVRCFTSW